MLRDNPQNTTATEAIRNSGDSNLDHKILSGIIRKKKFKKALLNLELG